MVAGLGRVPAVGDGLGWEGWRFEVVNIDCNRVDKVLATPPITHKLRPRDSEVSLRAPQNGGFIVRSGR